MKKIFYIALFFIIILPSLAHAVWWNPFSWEIFKKPSLPIRAEITISPFSTQNIPTTPTTSAKEQSVEVDQLEQEMGELKKDENLSSRTLKPSSKDTAKVNPSRAPRASITPRISPSPSRMATPMPSVVRLVPVLTPTSSPAPPRPIEESNRREKKIKELLDSLDLLENNYKIPLQQASGAYADTLLREYATKRLAVIDLLIPELKAVLLMPNAPYRVVSVSSQLLDIFTLKRENLLQVLNSSGNSSSVNSGPWIPPASTPPSYNYSIPPQNPPFPFYTPLTTPTAPKTPYEIEYDIRVCNSIGGTYTYGIGCSGY